MSTLKGWFEKNRGSLTGSWFLGSEPGTMAPEQFDRADFRVLIVRLSQYQDVVSGITHLYLYQMASAVENCFVDMAFLPPEQDERAMLRDGVPLLFGTTSKRGAAEFDLIAISNSVLQELINLPALLKHSKVPLGFYERERAGAPIVLLGGSNSYTHSILHGATLENDEASEGLVDCVLVGDAEGQFQKIIKSLMGSKKAESRAERVKALREAVAGVYDPRAYEQRFVDGALAEIVALDGAEMPLKASKTACSGEFETFEGGPILYEDSGSSHVILSAGCPFFCSFCKESWEQKPYREVDKGRVLDAALKLKAAMGLWELNLMTFNANTCTHLFEVVGELRRMFERVGIKSQRFDAIVKAPELLDLQFDAGKRTYTCAMEGISQRCRALLQKNLHESEIVSGISLLLERGMRQLKVFTILTGYERDEDFEEYREFLGTLNSLLFKYKANPRITFSFAVLFRAPQTPMQFAENRGGAGQLRRLLERALKVTGAAGFEARVSAGVENALVSEYIAFADRRHTSLLVEASVKWGLRYRGEVSKRMLELWEKGLEKRGFVKPDAWVRTADSVLPWDDIDTGVSKGFLYGVWQSLLNLKELESCIGEPWGRGACAGCGACKTVEQKKALAAMGPKLGGQLLETPEMLATSLWVEFNIPQKWALVDREFIKAALARRLMLDNPDTVKGFLRVAGVYPGFYSWGRAWAEIRFRDRFVALNAIDHADADISIIKRVRAFKSLETVGYPMRVAVEVCQGGLDMARHLDQLLSEYKIKNSKKKQGEEMHWEINQGHANKIGIDLMVYNKAAGSLTLALNKAPELYLLNKIARGKEVKVL